jgi:SAM-dependent methyltransferase
VLYQLKKYLPGFIQENLQTWVEQQFFATREGNGFVDALEKEAAALYVAGTYSPDAPELAKIDGRSKEYVQSYLRVHRRRLELTFKTLRELQAPRAPASLVDLGSWAPYVPLLQDTFPGHEIVCVGEPGDADKAKALKGVRWVGLDLESERLPIEDGSANVVLLLEVVEHFYQDPMFALAEANRILAPGGKLVMTTPNLASWRALVALLTHYSPYTYGKYTPGYPPHVHEYVPRELALLLKSAGFEPKVWTENVYTSGVGEKILFLLRAFGLPTDLRGDTLFAVGTKTSAPIARYPEELYDGRPNGLLKRSFELRQETDGDVG